MQFRKFSIALLFAAIFFSAACHHSAKVTELEIGYVEMNKQAVQHDSATGEILRPYKDSLDKLMNVVVGRTDVQMPKERDKLETLLGNFVTDISLQRTNAVYKPSDNHPAEICVMNNGGLRSSLPKGEITRGNIFELMPFDNELVVITLSGKKTWELLKFVAMSSGQPLSGMKFGIHPDKTPGTILIQGQAFDSTKNYKVVTSDYLANGGDKMDFFRNPVKLENTGYKIRDAILDYCAEETAKGNTLTSKLDGRFYYETK